MDRNNPYGRPGGMGLPSRQTPGGYPPAPAGYAPSAGRQPAPARPQNPPGGGYPGGYSGGSSAGAGFGGGEPPRSSYQSQPGGRRVPLRIAMIQDKTLQTQFIFTNL